MRRIRVAVKKFFKFAAKKPYLLLPLLLVASILPKTAYAGLIGFTADALMFIFLFQFYVYQYIAGFLFNMAAYLAGRMLELNYNILGPQNQLVYIGWTIARDIANLGFVMLIIVMAISTILRYEKYMASKMLKNLIVAAIAVNFSLTIAGVFIDFSHTLTRFFFKPIVGQQTGAEGTIKWVQAVSGAFNPQKLFAEPEEPEPVDPEEQIGGLRGFATAQLLKLAGLFFSIIFTVIATVIIFALSIMLLARYLMLSFLLLLSPITWLFHVMPGQDGRWSDWWKKFTNWTFFAPAMGFFMYIALASIQKINEGATQVMPGAFFQQGILGTIVQQGVNMIILCGIMTLGLKTAQEMGATGAGMAMKFLKDKGNKLKVDLQQRGDRLRTAPQRSQAGRAIVSKMQVLGQDTLLGRVFGAPIRQAGARLATDTKKVDGQLGEAAKGLGSESVEEVARGYGADGRLGKIARMKEIFDRKKKATGELVSARDKKESAQRISDKEIESLIKAEEALRDAESRIAATPEQRRTQKQRDDVLARTKDLDAAVVRKERAERDLKDANKTFADADTALQRIAAALEMLPVNVRDALKQEGFDLLNTRISKRILPFQERMPGVQRATEWMAKKGVEETPVGRFSQSIFDVRAHSKVQAAQKADATKTDAQRLQEFNNVSRDHQIATLLNTDAALRAAEEQVKKDQRAFDEQQKTVQSAKNNMERMSRAAEDAEKILKARSAEAQKLTKAEDDLKKAIEASKKSEEGITNLNKELANEKQKQREAFMRGQDASTHTAEIDRLETRLKSEMNDPQKQKSRSDAQDAVRNAQREYNNLFGEKQKNKDWLRAEETIKQHQAAEGLYKRVQDDLKKVGEKLNGKTDDKGNFVDGSQTKLNGLIKAMNDGLPPDVLKQFEEAGRDVNKMREFIKGYEARRQETKSA